MSKLCQAIIYERDSNRLTILNQLSLPVRVEYEDILTVNDGWQAIKQMKVRGAPAIAHIALMSLVVETNRQGFVDSIGGDSARFLQYLEEKADYLCSARLTAVNVRKEFDQLLRLVGDRLKQDTNAKLEQTIEYIRNYVIDLLEQDRQINRTLGDHGARHLLEHYNGNGGSEPKQKVNVLTHCNTGSIATAGYGTALGVVRSLHAGGNLGRVYCTETRPYNQGARLTSWELLSEAIPATLICDDMVAALMAGGDRQQPIDAVLVGADRVVANGDTANKIGTYQIALLAKHFGIPFYVAAPRSSIDMSIESGANITIEQRPANEMKFVGNVQIAPLDVECWNPAFDVTPAELITGGIVTEVGVFQPQQLVDNLK